MFTLNCKGKLLGLHEPVVMGIINITGDSFYHGHLYESTDKVLAGAAKMIEEGAQILDIGGQSTRPGSERISAHEEADRVVPIIAAINNAFPGIIISVDTYYSEVAKNAIAAGAGMVNDISGGNMDEEMIKTVGASGNVPYICMHIKGVPETMQKNPCYEDVTTEVIEFFLNKIQACKSAGIKDVIIDPGFGFGKNQKHNYRLLKDLAAFKILGRPILAGLSRKGMIYRTLGITAGEALNGTTIANTLALQNGADILRVHDVRAAIQAIGLLDVYNKA